MIRTGQFYIGGKWVDPAGTGSADVIDPSSRAVVGQLAMGDARDANAAIAAAKGAFEAWSRPRRARRDRCDVFRWPVTLYRCRADGRTARVLRGRGQVTGCHLCHQCPPVSRLYTLSAKAQTYRQPTDGERRCASMFREGETPPRPSKPLATLMRPRSCARRAPSAPRPTSTRS
ncbi:MAG: aldehyde dehydrogenase family protein [Alphaproteobacteria bacterium]|nr:aldehyde dehydrogenase family protein [Alphaproteobacteria bacterium]